MQNLLLCLEGKDERNVVVTPCRCGLLVGHTVHPCNRFCLVAVNLHDGVKLDKLFIQRTARVYRVSVITTHVLLGYLGICGFISSEA